MTNTSNKLVRKRGVENTKRRQRQHGIRRRRVPFHYANHVHIQQGIDLGVHDVFKCGYDVSHIDTVRLVRETSLRCARGTRIALIPMGRYRVALTP